MPEFNLELVTSWSRNWYAPPTPIYLQSKMSANNVQTEQMPVSQRLCPGLRDHWVGRGPKGLKHGAASHLSALGLMPSFAVEILTHARFWKSVEIRTLHRMGSSRIHKLPLVSCPQELEMGVPRATGPGPNHALHSRFLILVALQTAHLTHVHLGHVYVCVNHKLILANAGKGRPSVRLGAGGR